MSVRLAHWPPRPNDVIGCAFTTHFMHLCKQARKNSSYKENFRCAHIKQSDVHFYFWNIQNPSNRHNLLIKFALKDHAQEPIL